MLRSSEEGLAWKNKGDAFQALGRIAEAEAAYQRARELGED
jgi:tetratricopeptide (TPR) repeat protein